MFFEYACVCLSIVHSQHIVCKKKGWGSGKKLRLGTVDEGGREKVKQTRRQGKESDGRI